LALTRRQRAYQLKDTIWVRIKRMSSYSGVAKLILEGRPEVDVQAHLNTDVHDLRKPWGGYLTSDNPSLVTVTGGTTGRLRLSGGREGALMCQDVQTDVGSSGLLVRVVVLGKDEAPY
jgi:hypothetical protein